MSYYKRSSFISRSSTVLLLKACSIIGYLLDELFFIGEVYFVGDLLAFVCYFLSYVTESFLSFTKESYPFVVLPFLSSIIYFFSLFTVSYCKTLSSMRYSIVSAIVGN